MDNYLVSLLKVIDCRHPVPREGKCLVYSFGVDGDFTFENELLNEFGKHSGILSRMGALICITDRTTDLYHWSISLICVTDLCY